MPKQYTAIRDKYIRQGVPEKKAKAKAAAIYNATHPNNPVGPHSDEKRNYAAPSLAVPKGGSGAFTFDAGAPRELTDIYHRHYQEHRDAGKSHDDAHRRAIRMTQHAGWYKGTGGWKRLHPDVREKVNIREAVRQPDGRYVIENVPVFYPNAVKGKQLAFSADDIRKIIDNTNRSIAAGGQKPALLEGHPTDEQKALGIQLDVHGHPVNWREHPTKSGWAMCDLIDVEPEYVKRLQSRKLTGLSAGFAKDAGKLNRRFGHVALLGGTSQALSHLPTTEVFSVSGAEGCASPQYVCFSADMDLFPTRTHMKKMTDKAKACFAAFHSAYEAYEAAEKSHELGEPESDKKLEEAYNALHSAHDAYNAEMTPAEAAETMPVEHGMNEPANAQYETPVAEPTEATQNEMPGDEPAPGVSAGAPAPEFAADPEAAFNALSDRFNEMSGNMAKLLKVNEQLRTENNAHKGRQIRAQFDADVDKLRKEGRSIPAELADSSFKLCFQAKDPKSALTSVLEGFKKIPAQPTPAATGAVFSADEASRPAAKPAKIDKNEIRRALGANVNLSDDDLAYAAIGDAFNGE